MRRRPTRRQTLAAAASVGVLATVAGIAAWPAAHNERRPAGAALAPHAVVVKAQRQVPGLATVELRFYSDLPDAVDLDLPGYRQPPQNLWRTSADATALIAAVNAMRVCERRSPDATPAHAPAAATQLVVRCSNAHSPTIALTAARGQHAALLRRHTDKLFADLVPRTRAGLNIPEPAGKETP